MAKEVKGFFKMICAVCFPPYQQDCLDNLFPHEITPKIMKAGMTWHFSDRITTPTESCCTCHPAPPVMENEGKRITERKIIPSDKGWNKNHKKPSGSSYLSNSSELKAMGIYVEPQVPYDPTKLICSFCGNGVDRINATKGISGIKISKEYEKVAPDYYEIKTRVGATQVVACPSCAHNIRALTHKVRGIDKDGNEVEFEEIKVSNSSGYSEG